jgi:spore maturation protein CgeB
MSFHKLKIALISDELTSASLSSECRVAHVTPFNYRFVLSLWRPDLLFVESCWKGHCDKWRFRIASYPDHPERSNKILSDVARYARKRGVPTIFWNKCDSVHFERFIESARLFDHIFTVDENCIEKYHANVGPDVTVDTLMFAVQPSIHHPSKEGFKYSWANFVGSYSRHIHPNRRELQDMLLGAAYSELGLTIYDRNSSRKSPNYRYPAKIASDVRPGVPYEETAQIYRDFMVSLNINTVQDSATMFSRRVVEILACGGLAVTTPALSIERLFAPYCHTVGSDGEAQELFARLKRDGLSARDREMMVSGAEYVANNHTWRHRLKQICETAGIEL